MQYLTEKEWVRLFEEIYKRKPTPNEFMEGLRKNEFQIIEDPDGRGGSTSRKFGCYKRSPLKNILVYFLLFLSIVMVTMIILNFRDSSFSQDNFEDGSWIVMEKKKSQLFDDLEMVVYKADSWNSLLPSVNEEDKLTYIPFNKFIEDKQVGEDEDLEWPSAQEISKRIKARTGLSDVSPDKLMVISKGKNHWVFYWLNKDRAVIYNPYGEGVSVTQKLEPVINLDGRYKITDYNLLPYEIEKSFRSANLMVDFDIDVISYSDDESDKEVDFSVLSFDQFLPTYQLAGGEISDIKELDNINEELGSSDYQLDSLNSQKIAFIKTKDGEIIEDIPIFFSAFIIPVEYEEKVLLTTPVSMDWSRENIVDMDNDDQKEVLNMTKAVVTVEKDK